MHHSLKIKILDLDHIKSIVEQDITDVEAEKIVGGTLSVNASPVVPKNIVGGIVSGSPVASLSRVSVISPAEPLPIPPLPPLLSIPNPILNQLLSRTSQCRG